VTTGPRIRRECPQGAAGPESRRASGGWAQVRRTPWVGLTGDPDVAVPASTDVGQWRSVADTTPPSQQEKLIGRTKLHLVLRGMSHPGFGHGGGVGSIGSREAGKPRRTDMAVDPDTSRKRIPHRRGGEERAGHRTQRFGRARGTAALSMIAMASPHRASAHRRQLPRWPSPMPVVESG
jgi:hypothetical protein